MKKTLLKMIVGQTVGTESAEIAKKCLRDNLKQEYQEKFLNGKNRNRSEKRVLNRLIEDKLKEFDAEFKIYLRITTKFVKHFDEGYAAGAVDELVNKTYDFLDEELKDVKD